MDLISGCIGVGGLGFIAWLLVTLLKPKKPHAGFVQHSLNVSARVAIGETNEVVLTLTPTPQSIVKLQPRQTTLRLINEELTPDLSKEEAPPKVHVIATADVPLELPPSLTEPLVQRVPFTVPQGFMPSWRLKHGVELRTRVVLIMPFEKGPPLEVSAIVHVLAERTS